MIEIVNYLKSAIATTWLILSGRYTYIGAKRYIITTVEVCQIAILATQ